MFANHVLEHILEMRLKYVVGKRSAKGADKTITNDFMRAGTIPSLNPNALARSS